MWFPGLASMSLPGITWSPALGLARQARQWCSCQRAPRTLGSTAPFPHAKGWTAAAGVSLCMERRSHGVAAGGPCGYRTWKLRLSTERNSRSTSLKEPAKRARWEASRRRAKKTCGERHCLKRCVTSKTPTASETPRRRASTS